MKFAFFYVPSYSPHKTKNLTRLEIKLKTESFNYIENWESAPQAQEKFDLKEYVQLIQRLIISFIQKNSNQEIRIIGTSFGAGVLHHILNKIRISKKIKIFLFKPVFFINLNKVSKIKDFKIRNYEIFLDYQKKSFSIPYCELYYVFGDKDLLTGKPEENFKMIENFSKLLILKNSTHQSREDEFPQFKDFYIKFLEN